MKVIGIDGGATKVSGSIIEKLDLKTYTLAHPVVEIKYSDHHNFNPEFLPQPIDTQQNNEGIIDIEKNDGESENVMLPFTAEAVPLIDISNSYLVVAPDAFEAHGPES